MRDQGKEKQFDAEAYKKNLLSKSHGKTRLVSARDVISAYMTDQNEVNGLVAEENRRIMRRLVPNIERGASNRNVNECVIPDAYF